MKRIRKKLGVTLVELAIALGLFGLLMIPLYMIFAYGAADEINYDKVAAANLILESFKEEIKNLSYDYVKKDLVDKTITDTLILPPRTFNEMFDAQKDFKDFELSGKISKEKDLGDGVKYIEFEIEVTWTKGNGQKGSEKMSFIKVK